MKIQNFEAFLLLISDNEISGQQNHQAIVPSFNKFEFKTGLVLTTMCWSIIIRELSADLVVQKSVTGTFF